MEPFLKPYYKSGIYKITCLNNGKIYIGSSKNLKQRESAHFSDLLKNKHKSKELQKDFNSYGKDRFKFEIIEEVSDFSQLINIEQKYLNNLKPFIFGYNSATIAGSRLGIKQPKEFIESQRKRMVGSNNYFFW